MLATQRAVEAGILDSPRKAPDLKAAVAFIVVEAE